MLRKPSAPHGCHTARDNSPTSRVAVLEAMLQRAGFTFLSQQKTVKAVNLRHIQRHAVAFPMLVTPMVRFARSIAPLAPSSRSLWLGR
jgi:hypothetical protein